MSRYKAIFLDVDGTLVPDGGIYPSERIIQALKKLSQQMIVSIATGRTLKDFIVLSETLELTSPCTLLNGVCIYDPVAKKMEAEFPLPKESVMPILELLHTQESDYYMYDGKNDCPEEEFIKGKTLYSIFVPQGTEKNIRNLYYHLEQIAGVHSHIGFYKGNFNLTITSTASSKLHGVSYVQKKFNLPKEQCIAVGDSYNDFSLLLSCGLKVAMGNAADSLKKEADIICPSVENDGVAVFVEKLLLQ